MTKIITCINITIIITLNGNTKEIIHVKHSLWSNLTKIITVEANGKETVSLNTVYR